MMNNPTTNHVMKFKCIKCGEKNKLVGRLVANTREYGTMTKCCGCGFVETYLNEESNLLWLYSGKLRIVENECHQRNACNNTKCPLYEKCILNNEDKIQSVIQNDRNPILPELSINAINKNEKFK